MTTATPSWQKVEEAKTADTWDLVIDGFSVYGHISQYDTREYAAGKYHWLAVREDLRQSGVVADRETAMRCAEAALALPLDEFRQLIVDELLTEYRALESKILNIAHDLSLLPGYQAGFEAGEASVKTRIAAAL